MSKVAGTKVIFAALGVAGLGIAALAVSAGPANASHISDCVAAVKDTSKVPKDKYYGASTAISGAVAILTGGSSLQKVNPLTVSQAIQKMNLVATLAPGAWYVCKETLPDLQAILATAEGHGTARTAQCVFEERSSDSECKDKQNIHYQIKTISMLGTGVPDSVSCGAFVCGKYSGSISKCSGNRPVCQH